MNGTDVKYGNSEINLVCDINEKNCHHTRFNRLKSRYWYPEGDANLLESNCKKKNNTRECCQTSEIKLKTEKILGVWIVENTA